MAGHTRRFNPSHRWIRARITDGDLRLRQLDVQTYFLRRSNLNLLGQPRSWTDHLLCRRDGSGALTAARLGRPTACRGARGAWRVFG